MNYFAHGLRFLKDPHFLAGTAVPDWLAVVDRRVRLRPRRVAPFAETPRSVIGQVAAGVLQHTRDDLWFHRTRGFAETTSLVTSLFRRQLDGDPRYRTGFLGHISTELLLDAVLIERWPELLDRYYAVLGDVDPEAVQRAVNRMARGATSRLASFIPLFLKEQILRDYAESRRLLFRLNQVMRRIKLEPLPASIEEVLADAREVVRERVADLLPAEWFGVCFAEEEGVADAVEEARSVRFIDFDRGIANRKGKPS
ncbi:MAG TPA: hypothetical protein EYP14_00960 [Planctomycetaceae bacterium]|nr:hypothetical protein [Planctomycetaceae bacterium]